ncbi:MAG: GGDEF domain-containing protein [Williamsia herbipolensis]|nr:GGDEF domain-containing protein [Williamsia herbipolensis]
MSNLVQTDEKLRLEALHRYDLGQWMRFPMLDDLADLARVVSGTSDSQINIIDAHEQRTIAASGGSVGVLAREASLCSAVVATNRVVYTRDAKTDPRLSHLELVSGDPAVIRCYAGIPLVDPDGFALGSLCVWDPRVLDIGPDVLGSLEKLARQAVALLELQQRTRMLSDALAEVERLARTDPLTSLPNRRGLARRLGTETGQLTLLFADLDGFKAVNDRMGHDAGDQVLEEVARRLERGVRSHDLVARYGGDEFVVVCEDLDEVSSSMMASRLEIDLARPYETEAGKVTIGVSIGRTTALPDESATDLMRRADHAMYVRKNGEDRAWPIEDAAGPAHG